MGVKLRNTKNKEEILKVSRKESQKIYNGITSRLKAGFLIATMKSRRQLNNMNLQDIFEKKKLLLRIVYPTKLSIL